MKAGTPFVVLFALLVGGICAGTAHAQDIYVKPAQPSTKTPDLGIAPRVAEPKPSEIVKPANPEPVVEPAPSTPTPAPTPVVTPPSSGSSGGGVNTDYISDKLQIIRIDTPTQKMPAGNGGNTLNISIMPGGIGNYDKSVVVGNLGLNDKEMQGNCYLEYSALAAFGGTGDSLPIGTANRVTYRFSGGLDSVDFYPVIACRKVKRPVAGMIIEENGYYKLGAMSASCKGGNRQGNVTLTFKYLGDGQAACQFN